MERKKYKDPMTPSGEFQLLYQTSVAQQPGQFGTPGAMPPAAGGGAPGMGSGTAGAVGGGPVPGTGQPGTAQHALAQRFAEYFRRHGVELELIEAHPRAGKRLHAGARRRQDHAACEQRSRRERREDGTDRHGLSAGWTVCGATRCQPPGHSLTYG